MIIASQPQELSHIVYIPWLWSFPDCFDFIFHHFNNSVPIRQGKIVLGLQSVGMIVTQHPPVHLQHLLLESDHFLRLPLLLVRQSEIVHGLQYMGMMVTQNPHALLQHLLLKSCRLLCLPLVPEC